VQQDFFWKNYGLQEVALGYQPFSRKDPLETEVGSEKIPVRTPVGRLADKPETAAGPPGRARGMGLPQEGEPVVLGTRHLTTQRWGCWGAASQTGLYGRTAQETHSHCPAEESGGSASHYSVCPSQAGPGEAGPRTAAAAVAHS